MVGAKRDDGKRPTREQQIQRLVKFFAPDTSQGDMGLERGRRSDDAIMQKQEWAENPPFGLAQNNREQRGSIDGDQIGRPYSS